MMFVWVTAALPLLDMVGIDAKALEHAVSTAARHC